MTTKESSIVDESRNDAEHVQFVAVQPVVANAEEEDDSCRVVFTNLEGIRGNDGGSHASTTCGGDVVVTVAVAVPVMPPSRNEGRTTVAHDESASYRTRDDGIQHPVQSLRWGHVSRATNRQSRIPLPVEPLSIESIYHPQEWGLPIVPATPFFCVHNSGAEEDPTATSTTRNRKQQRRAMLRALSPRVWRCKQRRKKGQIAVMVTGGLVGGILLGPLGGILGALVAHGTARTLGRAVQARLERNLDMSSTRLAPLTSPN